MTEDQKATLWIGATRYYLGRRTYAVSDFCDLLRSEWPNLSYSTKSVIMREVNFEYTKDESLRKSGSASDLPLGEDCDRAEWKRVRSLWAIDL